jgi:hypothetical protein
MQEHNRLLRQTLLPDRSDHRRAVQILMRIASQLDSDHV